MSDYTLPPSLTVIAGKIGSGKSTFAYRHLINTPASARFIFDDLGRAAVRLRLSPCYTALDLERALPHRWVIFNPHRMFDGSIDPVTKEPRDTKAAFKFFCTWVYEASKRGPGKKLFLADEIWQWQDASHVPGPLAKVCQAGREENIEFVCATQMPHRLNESITGQSTELVCFKLDAPLGLARIRELGGDPELVTQLPLGQFISYNRLSGGSLSGQVF